MNLFFTIIILLSSLFQFCFMILIEELNFQILNHYVRKKTGLSGKKIKKCLNSQIFNYYVRRKTGIRKSKLKNF